MTWDWGSKLEQDTVRNWKWGVKQELLSWIVSFCWKMTKSGLLHFAFLCLLLALQIQETKESSLGNININRIVIRSNPGPGGALYDDHDKITLLNTTNFQSTICGSSTAWLVEFYRWVSFPWSSLSSHLCPPSAPGAVTVYTSPQPSSSWRRTCTVGGMSWLSVSWQR